MLSSCLARIVASLLLHHPYDEQLILKKGTIDWRDPSDAFFEKKEGGSMWCEDIEV